MPDPNPLLPLLLQCAQETADIDVVWLYGSRAEGTADAASDYDLAVAFHNFIKDDPLENRLRPELLALRWQQRLGVDEGTLSVIDINQVPIPLAYTAIKNGVVLLCRDGVRLEREEQRISGSMELDVLYHQREYG